MAPWVQKTDRGVRNRKVEGEGKESEIEGLSLHPGLVTRADLPGNAEHLAMLFRSLAGVLENARQT